MITQDQLKDVLDRAEKLYVYLKIDQKQVEWELRALVSVHVLELIIPQRIKKQWYGATGWPQR